MCAHACMHARTQSNTVTLSLATSSLVAVLAIAKAAHLICIVYVLQLISLLISQATRSIISLLMVMLSQLPFLCTGPRQSLNLHMQHLIQHNCQFSFCQLLSWLLHVQCCHQYIYLMPRQSCKKPTIHSEACRKNSLLLPSLSYRTFCTC